MRAATSPSWARLKEVPGTSATSACRVAVSNRVLPLSRIDLTSNGALGGSLAPSARSMVRPVAPEAGALGVAGCTCCRRVPTSGCAPAAWAASGVKATGKASDRAASSGVRVGWWYLCFMFSFLFIFLFIHVHQIGRQAHAAADDLQGRAVAADVHGDVHRRGGAAIGISAGITLVKAGALRHRDGGRQAQHVGPVAGLG